MIALMSSVYSVLTRDLAFVPQNSGQDSRPVFCRSVLQSWSIECKIIKSVTIRISSYDPKARKMVFRTRNVFGKFEKRAPVRFMQGTLRDDVKYTAATVVLTAISFSKNVTIHPVCFL